MRIAFHEAPLRGRAKPSPAIPDPKNEIQTRFNEICDTATGRPARSSVQELLKDAGTRLNQLGAREAEESLRAHSDLNPWHICFALGLSWGHLARSDLAFTGAAARLLENWNVDDLRLARSFFLERGPDAIEKSLLGAHVLFSKVTLPAELPNDLERLGIAQDRWLSPILSANRPRYIGAWNATAMFMMALFAQPRLAHTMTEPRPLLPPCEPIRAALRLLHRRGILHQPPHGGEFDDQAFEPGVLYETNNTLCDIRQGLNDWSLIDVHSGLYMLGTRSPQSQSWIS